MLPRYISAMLHRSWSSHSTIHAAQVRDLLSCLFITKNTKRCPHLAQDQPGRSIDVRWSG